MSEFTPPPPPAVPPVQPPAAGAPAESDRSFVATWLFSLLLGSLGVDRLYLGKIGTGLLKLVTAGGFGVWSLVDLVMVLAGAQRDKQGRPLAGYRQHRVVAWVVTGLLVVAGIVLSASIGAGVSDAISNPTVAPPVATGGSVAPAPTSAAPAPTSAAPAPTSAAPAAPGIGTAVRDGKFEFTVTKVETGVKRVGTAALGKDAQGQFVLVHLHVANIGTEAQSFDGDAQELVDTQGRKASADTTAAIYIDNSNSFLNQINPGVGVDGVVVFDIAADAVPASITLHDSAFSGGVSVALK